jgi:hypothetical protein
VISRGLLQSQWSLTCWQAPSIPVWAVPPVFIVCWVATIHW